MTAHTVQAPEASTDRRPIAITMGDPAGVGLQITAMAWLHRVRYSLTPFVVYADMGALEAHADRIGVPLAITEIDAPGEAVNLFDKALPVVHVPLTAPLQLGTPIAAQAGAIIQSIDSAVSAINAKTACAVVTNPIAKAVLKTEGFAYPGHTEYLGALARRDFNFDAAKAPVMMLASPALRVVPLTIHIPLAQVAAAITIERIIACVQTVAGSLKRDFAIAKPRIVVAGLNPHAGEQGTLGAEEKKIITPAVQSLQHAGIDVKGPLAADTMFHEAARQSYDVAICMYHDQALVPLKTLDFDHGVNITLGLPFVRTSPDHGTAFDIVGTNAVSANSFIASLKMARAIAANRTAFDKSATDEFSPSGAPS